MQALRETYRVVCLELSRKTYERGNEGRLESGEWEMSAPQPTAPQLGLFVVAFTSRSPGSGENATTVQRCNVVLIFIEYDLDFLDLYWCKEVTQTLDPDSNAHTRRGFSCARASPVPSMLGITPRTHPSHYAARTLDTLLLLFRLRHHVARV